MRTTLTLDPDVAAKAKRGAAKLGQPFKRVINSALRIGLDEVLKPAAAKPYKTKARALGLRPGLSYDNIGELLAPNGGKVPMILVDVNLLLSAEINRRNSIRRQAPGGTRN